MMESMSSYYANPPSSAASTQQQQQPQFPEFNAASLRNASPLVNNNNNIYSQQQQQEQQHHHQQQQYLQPSALDSQSAAGFHPTMQTSNLTLSNPPSSAGIHQQQQQSLLLSPPMTSSTLSKQTLLQSPSLNFSSLYSPRARFNASKGFDIEDDMEFCPMTQAQRAEVKAAQEQQQQQQSSPSSATTPGGHVNPYSTYFSGSHHKFNPYTTSFSPSSPSLGGNTSLNVASGTNYVTSSPKTSVNGVNEASPRVMTPRGKRLDQGNGIARVASPRIYK